MRRRTLHQRILIERLAAPNIDQHSVRLQRRERIPPNQLISGGRVRQRHDDIVAGGHEGGELIWRVHLVRTPDDLISASIMLRSFPAVF